LFAFASVILYFAIAAPSFLTFANIANVLEQSTILGVLACGMTIVMIGGGSNVITGGIDLSLANNLGLCAAVYASVLRNGQSDPVALSLTLAVGLAVGFLNAIAIVGLGILPLIATLSVMNICAGFELVLTQNTVIPATSPLLSSLTDSGPWGISYLACVLMALAVILIVGVEFTPVGLRLYAVGAYREAARAAGLYVKSYIAASYLSVVFAALSAPFCLFRYSTAVPPGPARSFFQLS
jgi:ribose transport system permease protein